jgi:hypothetical protein
MGSFLVVAGNGDTTRVNVEALIEDYLRSVDKEGLVLILPFFDRPSQGQIWAYQLCHEAGIPTTAIAKEGAIIMSLGGSSLHNTADPVAELGQFVAGESAKAFLLWDIADDTTVAFQKALEGSGVPCFNLCMGLLDISAGDAPEAPQKPEEPHPVLEPETLFELPPETDSNEQLAQRVAELVISRFVEAGLIK